MSSTVGGLDEEKPCPVSSLRTFFEISPAKFLSELPVAERALCMASETCSRLNETIDPLLFFIEAIFASIVDDRSTL